MKRKQIREMKKNENFFFEFTKIQEHFFKKFRNKLNGVKDNRHQSYVEYTPDIILYMIILKNIFNLRSMRGMTNSLNKDECINNISKVLGITDLKEIPHYDTINNFLSRLEPVEIEKIRTYMIKELLKKRCFEDYRIKNKYWGIIFDGTGLFSFSEKHCDHCLKREYKNKETGEIEKTIYMHHVLEAKLVIGDIVLSIGTEFIENESEDVTKQDCELNAFHRLAEKIKAIYPRLPICILGDSLYACEKVFERCDKYKWKYMCRFKEGRIESIATEFKTIKEIKKIKKNEDFFWANNISYNKRTVNLLETKIENNKDKTIKTYIFITNIMVTEKNVQKLACIGRSRWKIENKGFNNQKNIRYGIEHVNSHDYTAMKNHYLLTQIADILMQLYENGLKIFKVVKKTAKEISSDLLEAIRTRILSDEDIQQLVKPIQVRFY